VCGLLGFSPYCWLGALLLVCWSPLAGLKWRDPPSCCVKVVRPSLLLVKVSRPPPSSSLHCRWLLLGCRCLWLLFKLSLVSFLAGPGVSCMLPLPTRFCCRAWWDKPYACLLFYCSITVHVGQLLFEPNCCLWGFYISPSYADWSLSSSWQNCPHKSWWDQTLEGLIQDHYNFFWAYKKEDNYTSGIFALVLAKVMFRFWFC